MASCPETRERILTGIKFTEEPIEGTILEIKTLIGCSDVSNSKFVRALNSLRYHYKKVTWRKKHNIDTGYRELTNVGLATQ